MNWVLVFLGGGLGSLARFGVSWVVLRSYTGHIPVATFLSNLMACGVLGVVIHYLNLQEVENDLIKYAVLIGFCGGFSTFSTFSYESLMLMKNGNHVVAVANVILSVVVCTTLLFKLTK